MIEQVGQWHDLTILVSMPTTLTHSYG